MQLYFAKQTKQKWFHSHCLIIFTDIPYNIIIPNEIINVIILSSGRTVTELEAFKRNGWNHYRIEAIDDTMKTWINGVIAVEVVDIMTDSGFIALQVHSTNIERPMQVMWKNIRIKDFGFKQTKAFNIKRGTNISHWLSQSGRRGEKRKAFFTEKDVKYLAGLGFDHLRIPIDEEQLWDESSNRNEEAFELLKSGLDWCQKYNLKAIVDLHILRSHHFNKDEKPLWTDPAAQDHFIDLWQDLSSQLNTYPTSMVAYEFMNEAVADDPEDWNKLIDRVYKEVRKLEPNRVVVIGSNRWQKVDTFDQLRVPENDKNIILSFHMYEPFLFTHYKASWTNIGKYTGPVKYPGLTVEEKNIKKLPRKLAAEMRSHNDEYDQQALIRLLRKPLVVSKKYGLPLYCGEWGCLPTVPEKMRWKYYEDMRTMFDVYCIAYTNWDYKGSFGIIDRDGNPVNSMIKILIPDYQ